MKKKKRGQIAIEFILLLFTSMVFLFVMLISLTSLSSSKVDEKTLNQIDDLGRSLQQELILASELEDGYTRNLFIPDNINGRKYNITNANITEYTGYMNLIYNEKEFFYFIPPIEGNLTFGENKLQKINGTLRIK